MVIKMENKIVNLEKHEKFRGSKFSIPGNVNTEKKDDNMDDGILFKELKDDMREREVRSERRFQEQQELLLNSINNKLNDRFDKTDSEIKSMNDEIKDIRYEIKDVRNSTIRWGIGIIASIIIAFIGALPQLIQVIASLMQN